MIVLIGKRKDLLKQNRRNILTKYIHNFNTSNIKKMQQSIFTLEEGIEFQTII